MNGLSRICFGFLVDRYSFRTLYAILMAIQLVNACVCFWAAYVPALYFICILTNYMVLGGLFAVFPVSVMNCFGLKHGPGIYVQILFGSFISSLLNLVMTKWLEPVTPFWALFYMGAVAQVVVLVMTLGCFSEDLDRQNLERVNGLVHAADDRPR